MTKEQAVAEIVRILQPFRKPESEWDKEVDPDGYLFAVERDEVVREIAATALRELGLYDCYGCILCMD